MSSLQPKQFRQQTLWPTAAETTHVEGGGRAIEMGIAPEDRRELDKVGSVEFRVRRNLPNGGTQESWQSPWLRGALAEQRRAIATSPEREAELDSGQLAMFMTPREIHQRWEPLWGDRHDLYGGMTDAGTETRALQPHVTHRTRGGSFVGADYVESDEELWGRKLDESLMDKREYGADVHGISANTDDYLDNLEPTTNYPSYESGHTATFDERAESWADRKAEQWRADQDSSLYDSIAREGVRSPIRLGQSRDRGFSGGQTEKPQIVGGHHRLAVATDLDENGLVPVLHHRDIAEAKVNPYYRYT